MKKLILVDLDGTLADTVGAITEAVNLTRGAFGHGTVTEETVRSALGNGQRKLLERTVPADVCPTEEAFDACVRTYEKFHGETFLHTTACYDGMKETLLSLKAAGNTVVLYTNKEQALAKPLASALMGEDFFAGYYGRLSDFPQKPDPAGVKIILARFGFTASDAVLIGDTEVDVKAAKDSGLAFIGCAWGFRGKDALEKLAPGRVAHTPAEILSMI